MFIHCSRNIFRIIFILPAAVFHGFPPRRITLACPESKAIRDAAYFHGIFNVIPLLHDQFQNFPIHLSQYSNSHINFFIF